MDMKKKKRRTIGIVLMWVFGVLTVFAIATILIFSSIPGLIGRNLRDAEEETRQEYLMAGCHEFEATGWSTKIKEYEPGKDLHIYVQPEFYDSYDQSDHDYLGVLTNAEESPDIAVYPQMESTYIFFKESRTEVVTLPEDLAKRQIALEADIIIVDVEDVEGHVFNRGEEEAWDLVPWALVTFSFTYIIPLIMFVAGVIVYVVNKEKGNANV